MHPSIVYTVADNKNFCLTVRTFECVQLSIMNHCIDALVGSSIVESHLLTPCSLVLQVNEHLSRGKRKSKGSKLYNPFSGKNTHLCHSLDTHTHSCMCTHTQLTYKLTEDNTSRKFDAFAEYLQSQIDLHDDDLYTLFDASIFSDNCKVASLNKVQSSFQFQNDNSQQALRMVTRHRSHEESSHLLVSPDRPVLTTGGGSFDDNKMTE